MSLCYSSGQSTHDSYSCVMRPQYTQCVVCTNICCNEDGHKYFCTSKEFRSTYIGQSDVKADRAQYLSVDFIDVAKASLLTERGEIEITDTPLWIQNCGLEVKCVNKTLIFDAFTNTKDNRSIVFVDKNDKRRLQIVAGQTLGVNNHYTFTEDGQIHYNYFDEQEIAGPINCCINIHNTDTNLRSRVRWMTLVNIFSVSEDKVAFIDPVEIRFKKLMEAEGRSFLGGIQIVCICKGFLVPITGNNDEGSVENAPAENDDFNESDDDGAMDEQ